MKRAFDFFVAVVAMTLLSPLLIVIWAVIVWRLERPALFRQRRPGLHGKPFEMVKFKTMITATDARGHALEDRCRLTPLGNWLRQTSLDELPELWNVVTGKMSLVGPRPLLMDYLPRYSAAQMRRHEVRPGITGWAQVNGRNAISWEQKFELDVWYVDNRSMMLDFKILFLTVVQVLRRDGISSAEHATMPVFTGSNCQSSESECRETT